MTKEEAIALGVPENRLKEFQDIYHRDIGKSAQRQLEGNSKAIRAAIQSMLPLIHRPAALREILDLVTRLYCAPAAKERE